MPAHFPRARSRLSNRLISYRKIAWLSALITFLLLVTRPGLIFAETKVSSSPATIATNSAYPQYPPQSPQYANLLTINLIHTFSCFAEGTSIIGQPCLNLQNGAGGISAISTNQVLADGGAIGSINSFLTKVYATPPVQVSEYLASVRNEMGLVKPAYAQVSGSGNIVLQPILIIWQVFRNIAYIGLIFILIVIGLMIMFRQKINPQTVISAQAALPGLILGLVMITFSYFFAALLVDTTFVATHLAGKIFVGQIITPPNKNASIQNKDFVPTSDPIDKLLDNESLLSIYNHFINGYSISNGEGMDPGNIVGETYNVVTALQNEQTLGKVIHGASFAAGCILGHQINAFGDLLQKIPGAAALANCASGGIVTLLISNTGILGTMAGLVLYLVLMFALLIAMFKLLFALIGSYLSILVSTITAPLQFLIGSIPGREKTFTDWFKSMLANLLAFPAVFAMLILAAFILNWRTTPFYIMNGPTDFSGGTLPLLGGLSSGFLRLALAYGILLMSPIVPNMIKEALGVKDTLNLGQNVMGALGGGWNVMRSGFGGLTHRFQQERKQAQEYANLVRAYGPEWVAQRYGKAVQPSLLQPHIYFGQRDVFKPVAPWSWRKEKEATWMKNAERGNAAEAARIGTGQSGGASKPPVAEETPTEMAEAVGARERE